MIGTLAQIAFSLGCGFAQGDRASFSFCQFLPFTLNHRRSFTCCPPWLPRHWRCSHHTVCSSVFSLLCFPNATSSSTLLQLGMLAHSFPPSKARSMAFATFAAGAPVGGAVGMIIGGVLTQLTACVITARFYGRLFLTSSCSTSWRSVFYLAAGASTAILLSGMASFDADKPSTETVKRVDWIGALFITTGLVLIVFVLGQGALATNGWKTPCEIPPVSYVSSAHHHQISSHFLSSALSWLSYSCFGRITWNGLLKIHQELLPCGHRHH